MTPNFRGKDVIFSLSVCVSVTHAHAQDNYNRHIEKTAPDSGSTPDEDKCSQQMFNSVHFE